MRSGTLLSRFLRVSRPTLTYLLYTLGISAEMMVSNATRPRCFKEKIIKIF